MRGRPIFKAQDPNDSPSGRSTNAWGQQIPPSNQGNGTTPGWNQQNRNNTWGESRSTVGDKMPGWGQIENPIDKYAKEPSTDTSWGPKNIPSETHSVSNQPVSNDSEAWGKGKSSQNQPQAVKQQLTDDSQNTSRHGRMVVGGEKDQGKIQSSQGHDISHAFSQSLNVSEGHGSSSQIYQQKPPDMTPQNIFTSSENYQHSSGGNVAQFLEEQIKSMPSQRVTFPDGHGGDNLRSPMMWQEFNLSKSLLRGLAEMGFRYPSGIQGRALPQTLTGRCNVIAQSQNGTGKTGTYLITILSRIDLSNPFCQALVIVSTQELAIQVVDVARKMGKYLDGLKVMAAVPGSEANSISSLPGPIQAQLIVGTPGTIANWTIGRLPDKIDVHNLQILVLDEADQLMESASFFNIAKNLRKRCQQNCQILFFSATFDENVKEYAQDFVLGEVKEILLTVQELALKNVRQFCMHCRNFEEKLEALRSTFLAEAITGCLVFCKTREDAHRLSNTLQREGHSVDVLSGKMTPDERENVIEQFRESKIKVLISTNVTSRGLDILHVNLVVNWDQPMIKDSETGAPKPDYETYLHRVGRSGRFGRFGLAINLLSNDQDRRILCQIEQFYGIEIPVVDFSSREDMKRVQDPLNAKFDDL